MRDGGETIKEEALICGAVKVTPVTGDAPRLNRLQTERVLPIALPILFSKQSKSPKEAKRQSPQQTMRTNSTKCCTVGREAVTNEQTINTSA